MAAWFRLAVAASELAGPVVVAVLCSLVVPAAQVGPGRGAAGAGRRGAGAGVRGGMTAGSLHGPPILAGAAVGLPLT